MSVAIKALFEKNNTESSESEEGSLRAVTNCEPELISDVDRAPLKYAVSKVVDIAPLNGESDAAVKPWNKQRYRIDLAEQQVECELNYVRLSKLLVGLPKKEEWCFEVGDQQAQSYFIATVLDRAPYTTTLELVQRFATSIDELKKQHRFNRDDKAEDNRESDNQQASPESLRSPSTDSGVSSSMSSKITVCMYHDANMAEVIAWKNHKRLRARYEYPNKHMYQQDEKAQLNKFLGDWLMLCQKKGRVVLNIEELGIKNTD